MQPVTFLHTVESSVAQMVAGMLYRQARFRISSRHPKEVSPTEPAAVKI
jgi:hypothetical protein